MRVIYLNGKNQNEKLELGYGYTAIDGCIYIHICIYILYNIICINIYKYKYKNMYIKYET